MAWNRNPESTVAGYKVYWGRSSRIYEQVLNAGSNPQAVLPNLTPGQPYFCAVTAYNSEGQESSFSSEITVTYGTAAQNPDTSGRLVMLEAESGLLNAPMTTFNGPTESWVDSSFYSQLGWTQLSFNAPVTGDYHVWCRVKAPTEAKDSFFFSTDGGVEEVFHVYGTTTPPEGTRTTNWIWRRIHVVEAGPRVFNFDEGSHTLRFRVREQGTLLDRVVLSSDPAFVPTDALPRSGAAVVVSGITGNLSVATGSSTTLAVTAAATGPVSYQWFKGSAAIAGANGPLLSLQGLSTGDSGDFSVRLTTGTATATGGPVILSVSQGAALPKFQVTRFSVKPDRTLSFEVEGGLSSDIQIYASSDMVVWVPIGTRVNETGVIEIADPAATAGAKRRFYRLLTD
ncbi:fibronectin type III domain-containing protein [Luteolibacter arcticus]|uniref:Fibronectin type III domain-containing protein n=1 Tax=Luteolibacter arcticus TaxID=1581411 RepID=A0ABT3GHM7_9BACT|nr:fibronectin type III domain-containing protein [Luteolibacter arcticus]MCW1922908.1 fibronectin type III domain-containing protein [Luteolibacter arcticus]